MKAIIIASSIFYLLGLKISNNVDLVKKNSISPVIENKLEHSDKTDKNASFLDEKKSMELKTGPDSLSITGASSVAVLKNKEDI